MGGALGSVARYGVDVLLPTDDGSFPLGTFLVNVAGCLLVGMVAGVVHRSTTHPLVLPFVVTGLLGGFTTFSTYTLQAVDLALRGQAGIATGYLLATLVAALLAVEAGLLVSRALAHHQRTVNARRQAAARAVRAPAPMTSYGPRR